MREYQEGRAPLQERISRGILNSTRVMSSNSKQSYIEWTFFISPNPPICPEHSYSHFFLPKSRMVCAENTKYLFQMYWITWNTLDTLESFSNLFQANRNSCFFHSSKNSNHSFVLVLCLFYRTENNRKYYLAE